MDHVIELLLLKGWIFLDFFGGINSFINVLCYENGGIFMKELIIAGFGQYRLTARYAVLHVLCEHRWITGATVVGGGGPPAGLGVFILFSLAPGRDWKLCLGPERLPFTLEPLKGDTVGFSLNLRASFPQPAPWCSPIDLLASKPELS